MPPTAQERGRFFDWELELVERALSLREELRLPFWESVLLSSEEYESVPAGLLDAAQFHNSTAHLLEWLPANASLRDRLREAVKSVDGDDMMAIASSVRCRDGKIGHIPMVDFHSKASAHSERVVREVCRRLGGGFIVCSGNSYHFYGTELISAGGRREFLGRALLYLPIVDARWIGHQLQERSSALRISPKGDSCREPVLDSACGGRSCTELEFIREGWER